MLVSVVFRFVTDAFFLLGGGWLMLCLAAGLAAATTPRLIRVARRLFRLRRWGPGRGAPHSWVAREPQATRDGSTTHIDELFHAIEADHLLLLEYAGAHASDEDPDPERLISVSYLGQRAAVCAPAQSWITEEFQSHAVAGDAVHNMVGRMCDYAKQCRESWPRVDYDDAEAGAYALLANVPRELLTDPRANVAALAAEFNVPVWELTRANIEYACHVFRARD